MLGRGRDESVQTRIVKTRFESALYHDTISYRGGMMKNIYLQVGNKIRLYRKARNLTQEELGERLQIDQSYIGRIERGEVNITLDTLYKISSTLRVSPAQLLEGDEKVRDSKVKSEILDKFDTLLIPLTNDELNGVYRLLKEALALRETTRKGTKRY